MVGIHVMGHVGFHCCLTLSGALEYGSTFSAKLWYQAYSSLLLCSLDGTLYEPSIVSFALLIGWNATWGHPSSHLLCSLDRMWHEPPITSLALLMDGMWNICKPPIVSFDLLIGRNATWAIHLIFCFDHLDRTQHEPSIISFALLIRWNVTWATHRLFCFFHWIESDMSPTSSLLLCSLDGIWHEPPIVSFTLLIG